MKLDVRERIALASILPNKGNYEALKTIRRAKEMVAFTPEEIELYKLEQTEGNQWKWDGEAAALNVKDVPVDEYITNLVRNKLAEMHNKEELTDQYVSLYEKFVIAYK
jgi:hypothetical protein